MESKEKNKNRYREQTVVSRVRDWEVGEMGELFVCLV